TKTGAYGQIEIYSRTPTSWTDRLPESAILDVPESSSSGSGIGVGAANSETGLIVMVANVDPDSPCASVGQTCAPVQGALTLAPRPLAVPGPGIPPWVPVCGDATVRAVTPTRFRPQNVQMRVAPAHGNAAAGSFTSRGVVVPSNRTPRRRTEWSH